KDLIKATLEGKPVPRFPVGPLAVHYCARLAGYSLRQYSTTAAALAESVIRYYEIFRPDAVWVSADTWVSAEAMGAEVGAVGDDQPFGGIGEPLVQSASDIERIPPPDVHRQGRYALMIDALSRVVRAVGNEAFVVACFDQYPFSLAAALLGLNQIMLKVVDDPPLVQALMHRCEEYALAYGRALSEAGADMLSGGDSPAGLLGPGLYGQLAFPSEQRLIKALKNATGKPVSLHICGDTRTILPVMANSGADVLEFDHAVGIQEACRMVDPSITLWGNLDPVRLLAQGTTEQVSAEAERAMAEVRSAGRTRFVLSSGCTLAVETPRQNVEALVSSVRRLCGFVNEDRKRR
ncbi:MAG TPA: uroporphyrinogen decarboxylase family protein, partial [Verrucomicrobiae bacterium]